MNGIRILPLLTLLAQKPDLDLRVLDRSGYSPVHYATTFGNVQALQLIYNKNPASLGCLSQGWQTVLMLACMSGNQEILQFIISKVSKLRLDDLDNWKLNSLAYCVRSNNIPAFFLLLSQGAKLSREFKDIMQNTMLHYCTSLDRIFFLQTLCRLGFDVNVAGEKDLHPFQVSIQRWNLHTGVELLRLAEDTPWRHVGARCLLGDRIKAENTQKLLLLNSFPLPPFSDDALLEIQSEYIPNKIRALQTAKRLFPEVYGASPAQEEEPTTVFNSENARLKGDGFLNLTCAKSWYACSMLLSGTSLIKVQ